MATRWTLPAGLTEAVRDHHKKTGGENILTDIVAYSDLLTHSFPLDKGTEKTDFIIKTGATKLNLQEESIHTVIQTLSERLAEYGSIFEIKIENLVAYTEMVENEYQKLKKNNAARMLSRKEEEMSILTEISNAMVQGRPRQELLFMVLEGIIRVIKAAEIILFSLDQKNLKVKAPLGLGEHTSSFCSGFSISMNGNSSLIVKTIRDQEKHILRKSVKDEIMNDPDQKVLLDLELLHAQILPLSMHEKPLGAIMVGWKIEDPEVSEEILQTLSLFANQASLILGQDSSKVEKQKKRSSLLLDLD